MINELDVLHDMARRLERLGIQYMLTGSFAMNYYGCPRMTRDVDIVVAIPPDKIKALVADLQPEYYVDEQAVREAVGTLFMFNVIHLEATIKIDFVIRKDTEYRQLEFARRRQIDSDGTMLWIVSSEDLILSKLEWSRESHSLQQRADIGNLLPTVADADYLHTWARKLGVAEKLQQIEDDRHTS